MKKILSLLLVLVLAVGVMTSCEDILSKIPGLGGEQHTCESVCPDCNKCTDADCNDSACSDKCQGHHECEHVCDECGKCTDTDCNETVCADKCEGHKVKDEWDEQYEIITIAEAIALAEAAGQNGTEDRYYLRGTVKEMLNIAYGEMTLADETGEIYVYGTYSNDGALKYSEMTEKAVEGDEVLLHCILSTYNDNPQVKNARLIDYKHTDVVVDTTGYTEMSVENARKADAGTKVQLTGIVSAITYANGKIPSGFILVDGASTIYVYDRNAAAMLSELYGIL